MRTSFLSLVLVSSQLVSTSRAAEPKTPPAWLNRVTGQAAGKFAPPRPEQITWRGTWAGITAGEIEGKFSGSKGQSRLEVQAKTTGMARLLYSMDASMDSSVNRKTLQPIQAHLVETYSDEKKDTVQKFDRSSVTRIRQTKPAHKDDGKSKVVHLPNVYDLQSSLLYLRSQSLKAGDKITFVAYATDSPYLVTATVDGPEKITVPAGAYPAIRLKLKLESVNKNLALKPYEKAGLFTVWFSGDADRLLLKVQGQLWIGAATVELEKVSFSSK